MTNNGKRITCVICLRPESTCICKWIVAVPHAVEVLILQDPLEQGQAKGSARLLHLCLPRSTLLVGATFAEHDLQALLAGKNNILLYPNLATDPSLGIAVPPTFDLAWLQQPARLRLVVLDGTWRKSRKMLYTNPLLQTLPRMPLRNMPTSRYRIRTAHGPDQLSTLEACCYALMKLESDEQRFLPLLDAFDGFVAQQSGYRARQAVK